jgi:hypothetical protein
VKSLVFAILYFAAIPVLANDIETSLKKVEGLANNCKTGKEPICQKFYALCKNECKKFDKLCYDEDNSSACLFYGLGLIQKGDSTGESWIQTSCDLGNDKACRASMHLRQQRNVEEAEGLQSRIQELELKKRQLEVRQLERQNQLLEEQSQARKWNRQNRAMQESLQMYQRSLKSPTNTNQQKRTNCTSVPRYNLFGKFQGFSTNCTEN